jgi:putative transposase
MADIQRTLAQIRREPFADFALSDHINQLCQQCQHVWRDRLLTPMMTLRLFVLQILHGNTAITALRQLSGIAFAAASYCEARQRLPLQMVQSLLTWFSESAAAIGLGRATPPLPGQRVLIVDSSSFSMSDTPTLREHFGLPAGVKESVGYPVAKLLGLLDAATGMFQQLLALPLFRHDVRDLVQFNPLLSAGDILLGDRAFCSFAHLALMQMRGVFGCFRLHHRRDQTRQGLQHWKRSDTQRPIWMSLGQFKELPAVLAVRLVSFAIRRRGYRTRRVIVATTLLDQTRWTDEQIAELYRQRWQIETCFNHLKTTLKMNVLKCQTLLGVQKELGIYLLAYNLVRITMLRAAARQQVEPGRISFIDALRWLCCRAIGLNGVARLIVNPSRPDRYQPRRVRRRAKAYHVLDRPRSCFTRPGPHDGHR